MPTMITVPIGQRTKSIQFGAAYSPSLSFNPDKELLAGCSGILSGLGITVNTVPNPDQVTVDTGSFIQRGIIVDVASAQVVETPLVPVFPLYLVAENANEVHNSTVSYLFTTTPAADSVIIAEWPAGPITAPVIPIHISLCGLKEAIDEINELIIQRDRFVALALQTVFTLPGAHSYVLGSNKLRIFRNGKKLEESFDYSEDSTTQFTLNFPSIAGDIIECLIYQGAPPITSLALIDLTDITTDLNNGIKDPTVLRVSPTDAANPLATMADIVASASVIVGGIAFTKIASFVKTDGDFSLIGLFSAFVDFPGLNSLAFTPTVAGSDALVIIAGNLATQVSNPQAASVNLALDGIDEVTGTTPNGVGAFGVPIAGLAMQLHQGCGINAGGGSVVAIRRLTGLTAALHTLKLRGTCDGFAGGVARFYADAAVPFTVIVLYR